MNKVILFNFKQVRANPRDGEEGGGGGREMGGWRRGEGVEGRWEGGGDVGGGRDRWSCSSPLSSLWNPRSI